VTLSRVKATGRGRLSARLVIEGLEYEFVSAKRMERTTSDGRVRVESLDLSDMTIGASVDMMRATVKGAGMTVRLLDLDRLAGKRHGRVTRALWRSETLVGFLGANAAYTATTITLRDTTAFPASGVVHIGTEAILYDSIVGNVLTDCTRGHWQSIAQSHYVADGEGLADARVTDQPVGIEGRRVYLYLYGDGDDPQGDGTMRWRGVCATDVRWSGGKCEIEVDSIARMLDQPLGGDLSAPVGARGIHYTSASPWQMSIMNMDTEETIWPTLIGFYETQEEFCAAATTAIAAEITATSFTIGDGEIAVTPETGGYRVTYRTDSVTAQPIFATIFSEIDYLRGHDIELASTRVGWDARGGAAPIAYGDRAWSPAVSSTESYGVSAGVPRGTLGRRLGWRMRESDEPGADADFYRLYLGGLVTPTEDDALLVGEGDDVYPARIHIVDAATRSVVVVDGIPEAFIRIGPDTRITLGRHLASGNFLDVVTTLSTDAPQLANAGAMPLIVGSDFSWNTDVDDQVDASTLGNGRGFYLFEGGTTMSELLAPEMMTCGIFPRISTNGRFQFLRIVPPLTTDRATWTIDDTAAAAQEIERSPRGVASQLSYFFGYDPRADEWDERTITFRDVQTTSANRSAITIEIKQRSTDTGRWRGSETGISGVDRDAVARLACQSLGLFGMPTAVVTVQVDARYMDACCGDSVSLSSSMLPDIEDGCSAIVDRTGIVVAHTLEVATGRVTLGILMHTQPFVGYVPEFLLAPSPLDNGGDEWDVTVILSPYTTATDVADWLTAGDLVRVSRADDSTQDIDGTVVSIVDADTVRVQFVSTWTPGTDEWNLRPTLSPNYTQADSLARYCFIADSARRLEYSDGETNPQVLA
jgi:hypothetical protein